MTADLDRWHNTRRHALHLVAAEGLHFVEAMEIARARLALEETRREACGDGAASAGVEWVEWIDVPSPPAEDATCSADWTLAPSSRSGARLGGHVIAGSPTH